jgi:hypothetical protein
MHRVGVEVSVSGVVVVQAVPVGGSPPLAVAEPAGEAVLVRESSTDASATTPLLPEAVKVTVTGVPEGSVPSAAIGVGERVYVVTGENSYWIVLVTVGLEEAFCPVMMSRPPHTGYGEPWFDPPSAGAS